MNGRAKFASMQKLTFQQSGRITGVYKKVGDMVKAGDIIARMDTYEIDNELEQARIDLENEERALERVMDTSKTELSILQAEKSYQTLLFEQENASTMLQLALQAIENEYVNKKNDYTKLLSDYEKKQKEYTTKIQTYEEIMLLDKSNQILYADEVLKTMIEDLKFTADGVKKELDALDKVMLYTTKYRDTTPGYYLYYIGAKDQFTKNSVEKLFRSNSSVTTAVYDWANTIVVSTLSEVTLKSQLIQQYEKLRELADKKTELSIAITKMLEASIEIEEMSIPSISITDGRSLKSTANAAIDEILGLSTPETIGEKRKRELDDLGLELSKMKQGVDKAYIEYGQLEVEKMKKISDAKMDHDMKGLEVKIAKAELDELKKGENEQVRQIRNNIRQRQKYIETILKKYDAYVLKANFDGVITKMNLQL
ncbi:MAG: biotin/lipoyl-binding protein [Candidatus Peribacteria bacterium]|jgi:multidrug efflux pump subunit AcrA (membrane-fusion protein)|nr:biotin/lipoyl-binding protein [Candidatus Peribacteria bacterium]